MVHTSNYNRWQYDQFQPYIGETVLEIGSGLGNITQFLARDASYVLGVDIKQEAVDYTRKRLLREKHVHMECLDIFGKGLGEYSNIQFDTIVFSNVLEHIEDDMNAMKTCHEILQSTHGTLLLLVPAHMWLYGTIDKEVGHFRRYEKSDIIQLAEQTKFRIVDLYEFNMVGALGWYVNYCLLKRKHTNNEEGTTQVGMYDRWIVPPTRWIESHIPPIFGISYIAVLSSS